MTLPRTVPYGAEFVHPYGTRTIHRIDQSDKAPTIAGAKTLCGDHKVSRIDDIRTAGDLIPAKWDSWRLCPTCFRD